MHKTNSNIKTLPCKVCGKDVTNVGHDTVSVTCPDCVSASLREFNENNPLDYVQDNPRDSE